MVEPCLRLADPASRGRHRAEWVTFATRPNRDATRRPTSPADEHAKRAWAMFTPPSILHRMSYPLY